MTRTTQPTPSPVEGALRWVGDLDHPFYDDERQRHVWYESAMIGFQLIIMLQLLACGIVMIVVGPGSFRYALIGLGPTLLGSVVTAAYAASQGASYSPGMSDLKRSRGLFGAALAAVYVVGVFRMNGFTLGEVTNSPADILGFITGIVVMILVGFAAMKLFKRFDTSEDDDQFD